MAQFLTIQVRLGKITIEQVPDNYRTEVEQLIAEH